MLKYDIILTILDKESLTYLGSSDSPRGGAAVQTIMRPSTSVLLSNHTDLRFGVVKSGACGEATLLVGLTGGAGGASYRPPKVSSSSKERWERGKTGEERERESV